MQEQFYELPTELKKDEEKQYFVNILYPSIKIPCSVCIKNIDKFTGIYQKNAYFCVPCFVKQKDLTNYHVLSMLNFPIISENWSAREELLLMEGMQLYHFGNWREIANHIGTNKTEQDVEQHYTECYLESEDNFPKINTSLKERVVQGWRGEEKNEEQPQKQKKLRKPRSYQRKPIQKIIGFNPVRREFEVEYDDEAEQLIANLEFTNQDTQDERNMKFRLLQMYNRRLKERYKRREFVIQRQLFHFDKEKREEKLMSKRQIEINSMLKPFARFQTAEKHKELVEGAIKVRNAKLLLCQLMEYKLNGFKTLAEIEESILSKQKNQPKKSLTKRQEVIEAEKNSKKKQENLRKSEKVLCQNFFLDPEKYIKIKEKILKESLKQGIMKKEAIFEMINLPREITDGIIRELVVNNELIPPNDY